MQRNIWFCSRMGNMFSKESLFVRFKARRFLDKFCFRSKTVISTVCIRNKTCACTFWVQRNKYKRQCQSKNVWFCDFGVKAILLFQPLDQHCLWSCLLLKEYFLPEILVRSNTFVQTCRCLSQTFLLKHYGFEARIQYNLLLKQDFSTNIWGWHKNFVFKHLEPCHFVNDQKLLELFGLQGVDLLSCCLKCHL